MLNNNAIEINYKRKEIQSKKFINFISYFIIIDLLFLPYLSFFVIPLSLPISIFMLFFFGKIKTDNFFKVFITLSILVLLSALFSFFRGIDNQFFIENIKRAIQFLSTFSYYYYFKYFNKYNTEKLKNIIFIFILYQLVLSILFFIDPTIIVNLKDYIYTTSAHASINVVFFSRNSYMFVDPNTAAYFYLIVFFYYFENKKLKPYKQIILLIISLLILLSFASKGAYLIFILGLGLYYLSGKNKINVEKVVYCFIGLLFLLLLGVLLRKLFPEIEMIISEQINSRYVYSNSSSAEGSRFTIYLKGIKNLFPSLIGQGYILLIDNKLFMPHSDHLRILYSYGLVSYMITLYLFFGKLFKKYYLFILPALMAYSINTLIDEQKLFGIFVTLLSMTNNHTLQNRKM